MIGRARTRLVALFACLATGLTLSPALAVAEPADQPQVDVSVVWDKSSYDTGDVINADVTVKNTGTKRLDRVYVMNDITEPDELLFVEEKWGNLANWIGVDLDPGASYTVRVTGLVHRTASETVTLGGDLYAGLGEELTEIKRFSTSAPVRRTFGRVSGFVYGDKNNNGTYDAAEELPNVPVTFGYAEDDSDTYTTTSDATGRFTFTELPTVNYVTQSTQANGWTQLSRRVEVDQSDKNLDLRIRAVAPLKGELQAKAKFTKEDYQVGEPVHLTVTLTNSGTHPLTGIVATCNRATAHYGLSSAGPGWGRLASTGDGATLPPGESTFDVSDVVPPGSFETGSVQASCDFGYAGMTDPSDNPAIWVTARVAGGTGGLKAEVFYRPGGNTTLGEGVAGVRTVLVDRRGCRLGDKPTEADGRVEFGNVPAGQAAYSLYFFPPTGWTMRAENPQTSISVLDKDIWLISVEVAKGQGTFPVLPAQPADCGGASDPAQNQPAPSQPKTTQPPTIRHPVSQPPSTQPPVEVAPQPKAVGKLADTGADVRDPALIGMIALLVGIGLVMATRRRRSTP